MSSLECPREGLDGKILVVEDDADSRNMLADILTTSGFRVLTAEHGAEALRVLATEAPDLIVLDLMLPWVNGVEVLARARQHPKLHSLPVLVVTATGTQEVELRTFKPVRLLRKPLNVDAIVPVIHQLLSEPSTFSC